MQISNLQSVDKAWYTEFRVRWVSQRGHWQCGLGNLTSVWIWEVIRPSGICPCPRSKDAKWVQVKKDPPPLDRFSAPHSRASGLGKLISPPQPQSYSSWNGLSLLREYQMCHCVHCVQYHSQWWGSRCFCIYVVHSGNFLETTLSIRQQLWTQASMERAALRWEMEFALAHLVCFSFQHCILPFEHSTFW